MLPAERGGLVHVFDSQYSPTADVVGVLEADHRDARWMSVELLLERTLEHLERDRTELVTLHEPRASPADIRDVQLLHPVQVAPLLHQDDCSAHCTGQQ